MQSRNGKAYKEDAEAYVEHRDAVKQTKAALALLMAPASEGKKSSKKAPKKYLMKSSEKALQKTKEGVALANASAPRLHAEYQANYDKANLATETAKNKREAAATQMFQFYANLLSLDAKYMWNKIVKEQMEADPFKDVQGVSRKAQGDLRGSHSTAALCFTSSLCFLTMQLSKRSTTFPMCSRSPRGLAYIHLYSA
jgi:hypothetical protein